MIKTQVKMLDIPALAEMLNVPPSWVALRARKGLIPHERVGRYIRFDTESPEFKAWLAQLHVGVYDATRNEKDGSLVEDQQMARTSYQEGSIRKRKRRYGVVFELRYRLKIGSEWKAITEALENEKGKLCRDEKEAERARKKRMLVINQINNGLKPHVTFTEFVEGRWRDYTARLKPGTVASYQSVISKHLLPTLGKMRLDLITPGDITEVLKKCQQSRKTEYSQKFVYEVVRLMFEVALQYDLIEHSPVRPKIHRPQGISKEKVALTAGELVKVIQCAEGEGRLILLCLALTGIRVGELAGLRRRRIKFEDATLSIGESVWRRISQPPKTESSYRTLRIPEILLAELRIHFAQARWVSDDDFVFCDNEGRPYSYDQLQRRFLKPAFEAAGIKRESYAHGFHIFRHSAATLLEGMTNSLRPGQKLLGHSSQQTTEGYTHQLAPVESSNLLAQHLISCGLVVAQGSEGVQ